MPWLFAIDTTSREPLRSAENAVAGVRKTNCFEAAKPALVTAVSRFATAMSARDSVGAIGASTVEGDVESLDERTPSKWMSPPNARTTGFPLPSGDLCSDRATDASRARGSAWTSRPSRTAARTTATIAAHGTRKRTPRTLARLATNGPTPPRTRPFRLEVGSLAVRKAIVQLVAIGIVIGVALTLVAVLFQWL